MTFHIQAILIFFLLSACSSSSENGSNETTSNGPTEEDITESVFCDYSDTTENNQESVSTPSISSWTCENSNRILTANGIPDHAVGTFPNPANPNTISAQNVSASFSLNPQESDNATTLGGPAGVIGYMINGVKIDASTAESCDDTGNDCSIDSSGSRDGNGGGWNIEALGHSSFALGLDENNGHVQPTGAYHYHGMPEGLVSKLNGNNSTMTLIGWAADGFPIYARYGYSVADDASSAIKLIQTSYQLVTDIDVSRPDTALYSLGTFQQDWEYVAGSGDLDECNGRIGVTPEFPGGIYHYYATDGYPYLQRCVKGVVENTGGSTQGPPPGEAG